jgi:hypothetical protein
MAINFVPGQVAVSDPNAGGPTALSNIKTAQLKAIKLTSANFSTANVDTLVAILPADATIVRISYWVKAALSGGGVATPTVAIGTTAGGIQISGGSSVAAGAANTYSVQSGVGGIFQNQQLPAGADIPIWIRGACTVGNPTAGEIYLLIDYVR